MARFPLLQDAIATTTGGTSSDTLAFGSNLTAGSLIIAACMTGDYPTDNSLLSVSDTAGHTWYNIGTSDHDANNQYLGGMFAYNVNAGADTVTFTYNGNANRSTRLLLEFGGVRKDSNPLAIGDNFLTTTSVTTLNGNLGSTLYPKHDDCLYVGILGCGSGSASSGFWNASDWALGVNNVGASSTNILCAIYKELTGAAPATINAAWNSLLASDTYQAITMAFLPPQNLYPYFYY